MNYAVSEFKPILNPPRRLAELEEARDVLLNFFLKDGLVIAGFKFGAVAFPEDLEEQLRGLVGRRVGILRLDGRFLVRDLEGEEHAAR